MKQPIPPSKNGSATSARTLAAPRNAGLRRAIVPAVAITRRRLTGGFLGMGFVIGFGLFQGMRAQAAAASGPSNGHVASLLPLAANPVFYDSGKARGANAADIPLSGTTTAPNGATIEARIVRADTGAEIHPWTAIATVTSGAWSSAYPACQRSAHRLRAQVRVAGSGATPAQTTEDILVGHIACLIGQSEDAKMFGLWPSGSMSVPAFLDPAARDSFFLLSNLSPSGTYALNGLQIISETGPDFSAVMHMANVWTRNAPGEKVLFINGCQSGTSYIDLVDDTDTNRNWETSFADAIAFVRSWGADVGVVMSTWTAAPSALGDGYRTIHYPMFAGMYADGGGSAAYGANVTIGGTTYRLDHGFWDLTGAGRSQAIFDAAVTKMAFHGPHRFEDCSNGIDKFLTSVSGQASVAIDVYDNGGVDLDTTPRRFWTQGTGIASDETVVIEGSANGTTGWTTVHTHAGISGAHFNAEPVGALYQFYRATVTKTGGGSVSANVYITGISGLIQQKQDTRQSIRKMSDPAQDPVLAPIMLPKGPEIITYMNGTPSTSVLSQVWDADPSTWVDWTDSTHPSQHTDDGLAARGRHTAVAALYALGLGPSAAQNRYVPKFNRAYWDPDGSRVQLWYEDGAGATPRLSTTRRERGEAAIPTTSPALGTMPHRTEVAGFYRNDTPCASVVIAPGAQTGGSDVVQVNAAETPFTYADALTFLPGGASGIVQWPEDEFDQIWKNLPIAVNGITGVEGVAVEPMPAAADIANTLPAPAVFASVPSTGPYFTDPRQIGANATAITFRAKIKWTANVGEGLFLIGGSQLEVTRKTSGAATANRLHYSISGGTTSGVVNTGVAMLTGGMKDVVFSVDRTSGAVRLWVDGTLVHSSTLPTIGGTFASNRRIGFLGTDRPTADVEVLEVWKAFTADGDAAALGTPHKRIAAAAVGGIVETPTSPAWRK